VGESEWMSMGFGNLRISRDRWRVIHCNLRANSIVFTVFYKKAFLHTLFLGPMLPSMKFAAVLSMSIATFFSSIIPNRIAGPSNPNVSMIPATTCGASATLLKSPKGQPLNCSCCLLMSLQPPVESIISLPMPTSQMLNRQRQLWQRDSAVLLGVVSLLLQNSLEMGLLRNCQSGTHTLPFNPLYWLQPITERGK